MGIRRICPTPSNLVLPVEHYAIHVDGHVTQMRYEEQKNLSDAISIITLVSFPNTTFTLIEVLWFFFHLNFATVYLGMEQRIWQRSENENFVCLLMFTMMILIISIFLRRSTVLSASPCLLDSPFSLLPFASF